MKDRQKRAATSVPDEVQAGIIGEGAAEGHNRAGHEISVEGELRLRMDAREGVTPYSGSPATAPRSTHESRIGDDETHARLQAARNAALRRAEDVVKLDDVSATE